MSEVFKGLFEDEPGPEPTPIDSWHLAWILSDAPRAVSEARERVSEIARLQGISEEEAKARLAEQLREIE